MTPRGSAHRHLLILGDSGDSAQVLATRGASEAGRADHAAQDRELDRVHVARLVGTDIILDSEHALYLALHLSAVALSLGDDLDRLTRVLGHVQARAVDQ
jgi:hypothetical protein